MSNISIFTAIVELFPQDKGWHYVRVPTELSEPLNHLADRGLIAVNVSIAGQTWPTSLLPMGDNTHFIAIPAKVRSKHNIIVGDSIEVFFSIRMRD